MTVEDPTILLDVVDMTIQSLGVDDVKWNFFTPELKVPWNPRWWSLVKVVASTLKVKTPVKQKEPSSSPSQISDQQALEDDNYSASDSGVSSIAPSEDQQSFSIQQSANNMSQQLLFDPTNEENHQIPDHLPRCWI